MFDIITIIFLIIIFITDILSTTNFAKYRKANKENKILEKNKRLNRITSCQTLSFALSFFLFLIMLRHNAYPVYIRSYIIAHILFAILYIIYVFIFDLLIEQIKYNSNNKGVSKKGELKRPTPKKKDRDKEDLDEI